MTVSPARLAMPTQSPVVDAARLGIVRMDLEPVLVVPDDVVRAARLRTDIVLAQDAARGQQQRKAAGAALAGRHVLGDEELALAAHEVIDMHGRGAVGRLGIARPLDAAELVDLVEADAGESRCQATRSHP